VVTRPFLHAYELAFDHPSTGQRLTWSSELPDDLQVQLDQLGAGATLPPGGDGADS
jgi:23S rRNA pseudouridine1911/1915/1917 synthase